MDDATRTEIDKSIGALLSEMRIREPPIIPDDVFEHLKLHRKFYSLQDPSLVDHIVHKMQVQKHRIVEVIRKSRLAAVWLPDRRDILIDDALHPHKKVWASLHEVTHSVLPWHRAYFLGDTAETLDPSYQEDLEAEANYGTSALLFCGSQFTHDARACPVEWRSVDLLSKRYKASLTATLRRYVEHGAQGELAMLVSTPPWAEPSPEQRERSRYFVTSRSFARRFPALVGEQLRAVVDTRVHYRRGGPVGSFDVALCDVDGAAGDFLAQCFFNSRDILTLFSPLR